MLIIIIETVSFIIIANANVQWTHMSYEFKLIALCG